MTIRSLRRGTMAGRGAAAPFSGLAVTQLTQAVTTTDAATYTTASVTPTANRLVCVWVGTASATQLLTSVVGNGITYNQIASVTLPNAFYTVSLYAGFSATPSAGTIALNFAGSHTGCGWRVEEWTGSVTPTVRQFKVGDGTGAVNSAVTLDAAPQASSAVGMMHIHGNTNSTTPGTDFTGWGLAGAIASPSRTFFYEYDIGPVDGTADCSWVTAASWGCIVAEIGGP